MRATATLLCLLLGLAGTARADDAQPRAKPDLEKPEDKIVYALGLSIAERLTEFGLDAREIDLVQHGLADGLRDESRVSLRAWGHRVEGFRRARMEAAAEREKQVSAELLARAAAEAGATQTESGLVYEELVAGSGAQPGPRDRVKVHYHGTRSDGSVFDSSIERKRPSTFGLDGVIRCWTEGLQKMKVGGRSKLVCPAEIAYGDKGLPGKIRPGAALSFEVELLEVLPPAS